MECADIHGPGHDLQIGSRNGPPIAEEQIAADTDTAAIGQRQADILQCEFATLQRGVDLDTGQRQGCVAINNLQTAVTDTD